MTLPAFPSPFAAPLLLSAGDCCTARLLHAPEAQQQTRRTLLLRSIDGTDRQRQADRRSTFYRHCSAYYVGYSRSLSHHLSVNYEFQSREGKLLQRGSQWYTVDLQDTLTTNSQCSPVVLTPLITLV